MWRKAKTIFLSARFALEGGVPPPFAPVGRLPPRFAARLTPTRRAYLPSFQRKLESIWTLHDKVGRVNPCKKIPNCSKISHG